MKIIDNKNDPILGKIVKFEHQDTPIIGINNVKFKNLTQYCNFDLEKMDEEICYALSKLDLNRLPTVPGVVPPKLQKRNNHIYQFEHEVLFDLDGEEKQRIKDLNQMQRRKYLFYKRKIVIPWYFIIELKPNKFATKEKDLFPWNEISNNFSYLKSCVVNMPFKEIGRVVIYGSWPNSEVECHRDDLPTENPGNHINFNPGGYRPVYLYDSNSNNKFYLPEEYKFYAYNTTDYHGVDPLPYFSYTVRVDGIFNDNIITK
jgi:hypothetical protein